ncbi:MAG: hypothetical protein EB038_06535, partial [Cyclobacteriaceae bacterium]|nr:hypothetical protein [Cyclobacteriaceae bacterium]
LELAPLYARSQTFNFRTGIVFPIFYLLLDESKFALEYSKSKKNNKNFPTIFTTKIPVKEQVIHLY